MVTLLKQGVYLLDGQVMVPECEAEHLKRQWTDEDLKNAANGTIAHKILAMHNTSGSEQNLALRFDALTSHDLTYVGVIQTAKASGLEQFPIPYILTNCHNSLCAVGGTLNEDDHRFGLSAAQKYGGIYVPSHMAVIHSYIREEYAACGRMILGSDSHTRYGALGAVGVGEGGGELVKQLLKKTYDLPHPSVICVKLTGTPHPGVGPQDVALAIIKAVFENGFVKNKVLEFVGDGIDGLSADYRCGIDVMTTETACLSSIWKTDGVIADYYASHGRAQDYYLLEPNPLAYYEGAIIVELDKVEPMIALPFHPSNAYTIREFQQNAADLLRETERRAKQLIDAPGVELHLTDKLINGELWVDQGVVAGCAGGTFENLAAVTDLLQGQMLGNGAFGLSLYPDSQPVYLELVKSGMMEHLMKSGAVVRSAFCGPCFGAGDVPANGSLSIRHTTRNFPNREGSKPSQGQLSCVALMDARSIAATALNGGSLTAATEIEATYKRHVYHYDKTIYNARVYNGFGMPNPKIELLYGPNIADWPAMKAMPKHLLLGVASVIHDPVTTTDELIPSGDASTYRSNPVAMAEYTLSRKDPDYVKRAKIWKTAEAVRESDRTDLLPPIVQSLVETICTHVDFSEFEPREIGFGSLVYAVKPGDGSAREQAASCQRVLGGSANIAQEYATKRYRSNLINWGMIPFQLPGNCNLEPDDGVFLPNIRAAVENGENCIRGVVLHKDQIRPIQLTLGTFTEDEKNILLAGCLINFYRNAR